MVKTVKGYGTSSEANNTAHQEKKFEIELTAQEKAIGITEAAEQNSLKEMKGLRSFRDRFDLPLSDADIAALKFFRPTADAPELKYLHDLRRRLGG